MRKKKPVVKKTSLSKDFLARILDNIIDLVSFVNKEGVFEYVSLSHKRILDFEPDFLIGKFAFDFVHPDDLIPVMNIFRNSLKNGVTGKGEFRYRKSDGNYIWLETIGNLVFNKDKVVGIVFSSRDISKKKD